jgi:hypothetical protein
MSREALRRGVTIKQAITDTTRWCGAAAQSHHRKPAYSKELVLVRSIVVAVLARFHLVRNS